MNSLDLAVLAIILLSGLFAFARGFVREGLSIASWAGAAFVALYAFPQARLFADRYLPAGIVADATAAIAPFLLALVVLSIVTSAIARRVKASQLSSLDRTLGLIFGLARGALLACLAYVVLIWLVPTPDKQPRWMTDARTLPLLSSGADALRRFVPGSVSQNAVAAARRGGKTVEQEVESAIGAYRNPHQPGPAIAPTAAPSYSAGEQRDLNRLFEQNAH